MESDPAATNKIGLGKINFKKLEKMNFLESKSISKNTS